MRCLGELFWEGEKKAASLKLRENCREEENFEPRASRNSRKKASSFWLLASGEQPVWVKGLGGGLGVVGCGINLPNLMSISIADYCKAIHILLAIIKNLQIGMGVKLSARKKPMVRILIGFLNRGIMLCWLSKCLYMSHKAAF